MSRMNLILEGLAAGRLDEADRWVTMNGTHVLVDSKGNPKSGEISKRLRNLKKEEKKKDRTSDDKKFQKERSKYSRDDVKSGNKDIDDLYSKANEHLLDARAYRAIAYKAYTKEKNRLIKDECSKLGINTSAFNRGSQYRERLREIEKEVRKLPEYIKYSKSEEAARRKYEKTTVKFNELYDTYKKSGKNLPKDFYILRHEFDDFD